MASEQEHAVKSVHVLAKLIRHGKEVEHIVSPIDYKKNLKFSIYLLKYGCGADFYNVSVEDADEKYYKYKPCRDLIPSSTEDWDTDSLDALDDDPKFKQIGVSTFPNQIEAVKQIVFIIEYRDTSIQHAELKIDNPELPLLFYFEGESINHKLKTKHGTFI